MDKKTEQQIRELLHIQNMQLRGEPEDWRGWFSREAYYKRDSINIEERSIDNIVTTEKPVLVFDWERWEPIYEILLVDGIIYPETGQVPTLDQHSRFTLFNLLGSTRNLTKQNNYENLGKVVMGRVFINREWEKAVPDPWGFIRDGDLTDTSIGYRTFDDATRILKKGESTTINGVPYKHELDGDYLLAIREKSEIKENSLVLIGANDAAKLKRSADAHLEAKTIEQSSILGKNGKRFFVLDKPKIYKLNRSNTMKLKDADGNIIDVDIDVTNTPEFRTEVDKKLAEQKLSVEEKETANNERIAELLARAEEFQAVIPDSKPIEKVNEFIKDGKSVLDYFRWYQGESKKPQPSRKGVSLADDLNEKEIDLYEMRMAIFAGGGDKAEREMKDKFGDKGVRSLGLVKDISEELSKRHSVSAGGVLIDTGILDKRSLKFKERLGKRADQNVGTDAAGGYTVNEQIIAQSFIEYLSNLSVFINGGVTVLSGMVGDIPFIKELDELTAYALAESGAPATGGLTFSRVNATPKTIGALTSISRQMLLQSAWVSEAYLRRKIIGTIQRYLDNKIAYGLGTGNEIMGIKNETGVNGLVGTNFNRGKALTMIGALWSGNAEIGGQSWITHPNTQAVLMNKMIGDSGLRFLWEDNDIMVARRGRSSNQVTEGDLFLGGFSTILLLEWGILEVDSNPYGTGWAAGDLQVKGLLSVDTFFEYPQALNVGTTVN